MVGARSILRARITRTGARSASGAIIDGPGARGSWISARSALRVGMSVVGAQSAIVAKADALGARALGPNQEVP